MAMLFLIDVLQEFGDDIGDSQLLDVGLGQPLTIGQPFGKGLLELPLGLRTHRAERHDATVESGVGKSAAGARTRPGE